MTADHNDYDLAVESDVNRMLPRLNQIFYPFGA
ncbi:MAG: hypothetical protein CM1200mP41_24450 [Gammaproteobacteria bacterium]|nr:MAG: hypothetical protein CM1200mP41_24450 [Gammaproteobacteria bacterium]